MLTNEDIRLLLRGKLYRCCVRSCVLDGSETWPMTKQNELTLWQVEMRMIRWMCGWC